MWRGKEKDRGIAEFGRHSNIVISYKKKKMIKIRGVTVDIFSQEWPEM